MTVLSFFSFLFLLACVISVEIVCPYTKVEESFGMQAMHDFLLCGKRACFDHLSSPGVVPRTFTGPWFVASLAMLPFLCDVNYVVRFLLEPLKYVVAGDVAWFVRLVEDVGLVGSSEELFALFPMLASNMCRVTLGVVTCCALGYVGCGIDSAAKWEKFKSTSSRVAAARCPVSMRHVSSVFYLLCLSQFHLVFYATRPLPNTYGLIMCTLACGATCRGKYYWAIALLSATSALFRCDVLVLLAPYSLFLLLRGDITLLRGVAAGICSVAAVVIFSIGMDSYLWGRLVWPEAVVLLFNTAENQSWRWGRLPVYWYVLVALPRSLLFLYPLWLTLVCMGWGNIYFALHRLSGAGRREGTTSEEPSPAAAHCALWVFLDTSERYADLLVPSSLFIVLYSLLPHKEVRFLMIVFPWLLVPLAAAGTRLWDECFARPLSSCTLEVTKGKGIVQGRATLVKWRNEGANLRSRGDGKGGFNVRPRWFLACLTRRSVIASLIVLLYTVQLATVLLSVYLSADNYPGSEALRRLHHAVEKDVRNSSSCLSRRLTTRTNRSNSISVFIDAYAAMTGISRFQKVHKIPRRNPTNSTFATAGASQQVSDRFVKLLTFPFRALMSVGRSIVVGDTGLHDEELFGTGNVPSPAVVSGGDSSRTEVSDAFSLSILLQRRGLEMQYIKEEIRFDETNDLYNSEGIDYVISRYSQRELHRKHGEYNEIAVVHESNRLHMLKLRLMQLFWLRKRHEVADQADPEGKPFLIALGPRC
ncbi:dolichyl-P-Man:GDP-Man7GlcNAc2-PP-dolichyl alpha-1,6-mannosyltransferase, putative [Trypanosoma equiperdum]|uniref:Mannosyltransferase n=1 Tax=Trypanosoma equiperdum TaxID=5694 RepID=A0A1G4I5B0_TRYEQ|nr:dolichyl-P-Man:GDP-Man7GlcNAc2-PP-dolichyl alpha-1,6-mannosyltransferase, putative [Trypanosoma equiperdum]